MTTPQVYPKDWALISSGLTQWSDSLTGGQKAFIGATLAVSTIGAGYMFYLRSKKRKQAGERVRVINDTTITTYPNITFTPLPRDLQSPVESGQRQDQARILAEIPNERQPLPAQHSIEEIRKKRLEYFEGILPPPSSPEKKCCACNSPTQTSLQQLDCNHFICTGSNSCYDKLAQENEIQCPTCNQKSHLS